VRKSELLVRAEEALKRKSDPVPDMPRKLRSRTIPFPIHVTHAEEEEVAGPSSAMFSVLPRSQSSIPYEDYDQEMPYPLSPDSELMPPPMTQQSDYSVLTMESQATDASESQSQSLDVQEVPSEDSAQAISLSSSQAISVSSFSIRSMSSPVRRGEVPFILPGISSVPRSESRCVVCKSRDGRSRIPTSALIDLWVKTKIFVPSNNRTCAAHLESGKFLAEAIGLIVATKKYAEVTGLQVSDWMTNLADQLGKRHRPVDFNSSAGLTDEDFRLLTGIGRESFGELVDVLKGSKMRESSNRSICNALGMFLVMLRLNLSQRVIAFMFGVNSQSSVSEAIDTVSEVLLQKFVPLHLGYQHLTREELLHRHMRSSFTTILERDPDDLILILDGTYLYVEKPLDQDLQRRSYSSYKHRNLFKPMMVVTPSGYVLEAEGLYYSDGANNDAKILKEMWYRPESIISVLESRDCLILDRGFRDVIEDIERSKVHTFMPNLLKKDQSQFTAEEANQSRKITKLRWIVEAANGRFDSILYSYKFNTKLFYSVQVEGRVSFLL
jgi:hypothetical protein